MRNYENRTLTFFSFFFFSVQSDSWLNLFIVTSLWFWGPILRKLDNIQGLDPVADGAVIETGCEIV
jgi:hypothetical protein